LPQAGLSILAARPKAGKSTLARNLVLAVARGEPFLGRTTTAGTVLYLALEEKRAELRRHFRKMGANDEPILIYCATAPADGVAQLSEAVMQEPPALVIIDPIIRLSRMVDSNSYSEVSKALEPFIALARDSGAHVMLVHHAGRANPGGVDAPMGSTAFAGSVDTILVMTRTDCMRTLSSVQRYGDDLDEIVLTMDDMRRINVSGTKQQFEEREARKAIVAFLEKHPDAKQKELREKIKLRWQTVWAALAAMIEDGTVTRQGEGGKQDPYKYYLTPPEGEKESKPQAEKESEKAGEEPQKSSESEAENQAKKSAPESSCSVVPNIYREQGNNNRKSDPSDCNHGSYSCSRDSAFSGTDGNKKNEAGNKHFESASDAFCQACNGTCQVPLAAWINPTFEIIRYDLNGRDRGYV
jgi:hypothetical protein